MGFWRRLWRRKRMEERLDQEIRFHLDTHASELIARGYDPGEARRLARLELGGPEQVKENCRDARGARWLEDLSQDLRYVLRTMRRQPGFATIALLTLALGTGATTAMFTVVNGVLLKPLPFPQPDRLSALQEQTDWSTQWGNLWAFTYPNYLDCKRESRALDMAAWRYGSGTLSEPGEPENVESREVAAGVFAMLGIPLLRGREFLPEEDRTGAKQVAIISYSLWQQRFNGSPSAIGQQLTFEGKAYTITGIAPARFRLGDGDPDVFTPIGQSAEPVMRDREAHPGIRVWARLRPDVTLAAARAELELIGQRLEKEYPKSNKGRIFVAETLRPNVGDVRPTLWLLLGAVGMVLLIGCVNVAALLLARALSRERELAMRMALGAGRGRVVRQCLTESAVLGLCGGALGILLAAAGIRPFVAFWPGSLPRADEVQLDWRVLLFALGVSLACGLLFGLAPALRAPSRDLEQTLRAGGRTLTAGSNRLHGGLVVSEIALAVVLLVSAGMLGRTLLHLSAIDPGLNVRNVLTARAGLSPSALSNPEHIRAAWNDLLDRARRVPGVQAVAMVDTVPMREGNNTIGYATNAAAANDNQQPLVLADSVSADYLSVMQIPLRRGRFFDDRDRIGNEPVVVIDEVMAQEAFHGQDPLGKHLWIGLGTDPLRVVGVVGHVRYWGPAADDRARVRAQLYYPFAQVPDQYARRWTDLMSIAVRTGVEPLSLVEPLRRQVRGAGGDQVLYEVHTLEQLSSASLARQRFLLLLFGIFAALALLLACVGIYGVLAYLTSRRVPEIGVRMTLGATAGDVMWMVLRQSLTMIGWGVVLGAVGALAAGRALGQLVEGMQPNGPLPFAIMIAVLVAAALIASFLPARRASRVDPIRALRQE